MEKVREFKDTTEKQQNQIEEMERRIRVLEGDLEAAEEEAESNKAYANYVVRMLAVIITFLYSSQENQRAGEYVNHTYQRVQNQGDQRSHSE